MEIIEIIKMVVMWVIGGTLIYLAIKKEYEPALLLPMGFGAILVNLPNTGVIHQYNESIGEEVHGIVQWLYEVGIEASEAFPILLFIGIGAMIDFEPLLQKPILVLYGFAAHLGIFVAIGLAYLLGFNTADAFSIGIIGAADGPTAILMSQILNSQYMGPIAVAAYSYMALVPIIMPTTIKLITTKEERQISMPAKSKKIPHYVKILFPIIVTIVAGFVAPMSIALVGFLMFGNLIRECKVLESLSRTAQDVLVNLITLLLGITISFSMTADKFLQVETLFIMLIGLVAFIFDTVGGVVAAKIMNLFMKEKINPMVGAAGISAFPMASRVVQKMAGEDKPGNIIIMQAAGANVSGQVASAIIGGILLGLF